MKKYTTEQIITALKSENIKTWFDLGLFLDRFKENVNNTSTPTDFDDFKNKINNSAVAFVSFFFAVDGITVEVEKYAKVLKQLYNPAKIHYIAGKIHQEASEMIAGDVVKKEIPEIDGFDNWPLYNDFFKIKMERGSKEYNALIGKFWNEVLNITEILGKYIEENNIQLLYLVNTNSNPGNVSLALSLVFLSEYMGIPVINNNHDFYWEGGHRQVEIETKGLQPGPRDFFFYNSHVGEFFSIIENIYPLNSRSWFNLNINKIQLNHLIEKNGINPANTGLIGTSVDEKLFKQLSNRAIINAYNQIASIFANNNNEIVVKQAKSHKKDENLKPTLFGYEEIKNFDFVNNNIILLQPTRVISRKNIETNFLLVKKLFEYESFAQKFDNNPELKISIIVSGPIPPGQQDYYNKLIGFFCDFLKDMPEKYKNKIYLGFLFSYFDRYEFRKKYNTPIDIKLLYNIASLILLPSQTEGRGLPIIEAAAAGTPIFCRQYEPREVFNEVIGYNLSEENRLRVLEFKGTEIPERIIRKIEKIIFYPQNILDDIYHNLKVVKKRYSIDALSENMNEIFYKLYLQLSASKTDFAEIKKFISKYSKLVNYKDDKLDAILNTKTRHYLPGYNRYAFMIYLKSLIDPSFFRVEEQFNRGEIFKYALYLVTSLKKLHKADTELIHKFFNIIESMFFYSDGEISIRHDHSLAYRHRNKKHYPYQDFTFQEITGLVNMIFQDVLKPKKRKNVILAPQFFADWNLALFQLTNSTHLAIDNRDILTKKLKENVPKAYFPGKYIKHELEYFVLQPIRAILNLKIEEELTEEILLKEKDNLAKVYIFIHERSVTEWFSNAEIIDYLTSGIEPGLTLLYKHGVINTIKTKQWSNGVHFPQMGAEAIKTLKFIKEHNGFIITSGEYAAMMTDIVDIDHFHIGKAEKKMTAKIMGIPQNSGFIQFVPAGMRTSLAYPTPVQTAKDFDEALKSDTFFKLKEHFGEKELFSILRKDAETKGTPLKELLNKLLDELENPNKENVVLTENLGGVYADGLPWSGVKAEIDLNKYKWKFAAYFAKNEPKNVPSLIEEYKAETNFNKKVEFAWNGGYILNPELVGKLGLPETYIGSPLGLLIIEGKIKCPPLFNKPAFIIYKNGNIDIKRVNISAGFEITGNNKSFDFTAEMHNKQSTDKLGFFDLSYTDESIEANGNVIVRLAGNTVKDVIYTEKGDIVNFIPVGLTLSIPKHLFDNDLFKIDNQLDIKLNNNNDLNIDWQNISYAIEAGPMLVNNGEVDVNMQIEGWKTPNSIKTQAARLDFTDMRGPKIAVGINNEGKLMVLMVNGRIRESVGATHFDMAEILKNAGMVKAMGFDPGGSSTLVVDNKVVNISPYNKDYEKDIYSLPPQARFVSNIIMAWIEK